MAQSSFQQQQSKIPAGKPNFATQAQVMHLQNQIDAMKLGQTPSHKPGPSPALLKEACQHCPSSLNDCVKITDTGKNLHCKAMVTECKMHCPSK